MKIAFHSNQLCIRGTSVAIYDYAHFNETLLNNKSVIIYQKNHHMNHELGIKNFKNRFEVFEYENFSEVDSIIEREKIDVLYMIKGGEFDGKITKKCKCVVHSVFQNYDPHGDVYAYIAEWEAKKMSGGKMPFVTHMFNLPQANKSLREQLKIPKNAIVFGRHGGYDEFNIPFVQKTIERVALNNKFIYFLFLNTKPFCMKLPNIIHLDPIYDLQEKSNFLNTCDAMMHGRLLGEIFSLSIGEFLTSGKPVISWVGGSDEGHHHMLKNKGIWYDSPEKLYDILVNFDKNTHNPNEYKNLVSEYTPENVMKEFKRVFLD
jgi:hypothetical protein